MTLLDLDKTEIIEEDSIEVIATESVIEDDLDSTQNFSRDCFVCNRHFTDKNLFFVHLTIHKVDPTVWKARNYKRSTMQKLEDGGVNCVGCTYAYKPDECFVSMDGKMFVCSFCYDSTRLDYMRKYGIKKDGLFPYEDFLLGEHMKAETNNGWKPAYMKLNKEEKIARINEILKELRQNPTLPLATLLTKWSITKEDFDLYRENGMISRGKTSRGRASMHENSSNSLTLVCPVTKLPLPVIAKIRGIIKDQKNGAGSVSELLEKWDVDENDFETYTSLIDMNTDVDTDNRSSNRNSNHGNQSGSQNILHKSSISKSFLKGKNVFKVATIPVSLSQNPGKSQIPPNVYVFPKQEYNAKVEPKSVQIEMAKFQPQNGNQPFIISQAGNKPASSAADWLNGNVSGNFHNINVARTFEKIKSVTGKKPEITVYPSDSKVQLEKLLKIPKPDNNRSKRLKKSENTCVNCGTKTATLWRRIKSPEEIEAKRPYIKASRDKLEYTGKLACNSCALYWSLHGKHRQPQDGNDAPRKRNRVKRTFDVPVSLVAPPVSAIPKNNPGGSPKMAIPRLAPKPSSPNLLQNTPLLPEPAQENQSDSQNLDLFGLNGLGTEQFGALLQLLQLQAAQNQLATGGTTDTPDILGALLPNLALPSNSLKRPFEGNESVDEEPSSDDSPSLASKVPKTEFVEATNENVSESFTDQSFTDQEPIDYSLTSTSDDTEGTASEVDKLKESPEHQKNLDNFQMFCHVCLKVLKKSVDLQVAQCFMCPKAIYCKNCIYSVNHLKIHSGLEINKE